MDPRLKERLGKGDVLVGTLATLASPEVAEILAQVGFDWVWIEMEHSPIDLVMAQVMIQAVGGRCPCIVRSPWNDSVWIKRILDIGCNGIVIPQIKTASEAEQAIKACKYPPEGIRGVGIARAHGYGMNFNEYVRQSNELLAVILQIEHSEAVTNIEVILDVPGIDAVVIGPYDLSGSMGLVGQVTHQKVQDAIHRVKSACLERKIPVGIFVADANTEAARRYISDGYTLIALGTDAMYLLSSARKALQELDQLR